MTLINKQVDPVFWEIYRTMIQVPRLLFKAISKPKYIFLCLWAFQQLWMVNSQLKTMALTALKIPTDLKPETLSLEKVKEIRQRAKAIAWTAKIHPLRPQCLHRSLVLHQWLQTEGINAQLAIGWGDKIGHAWVTYNGQVLNDRSNIAQVTPRLI